MPDKSVATSSVGVRVQSLNKTQQVLVIARLVADPEADTFDGPTIEAGFERLGLPLSGRARDSLSTLGRQELIRPSGRPGVWRMSPRGRQESLALASHADLQALEAEAASSRGTVLGSALHSLVSPALAPASLLRPVTAFNETHNFDTNVFGMTRFPDDGRD